VILLDTHVLLWLDRDDASLGVDTRASIAEAWDAGRVAVSAISFWEVALLHQRGRVALRCSASKWRTDWLEAGLQELPLDGATALLGAGLRDFHADPADRFIAATALRHQACLLTADRLILAWPGTLQRTPADT
jgi:PIN domain nuclease of toxin-antitoxin system